MGPRRRIGFQLPSDDQVFVPYSLHQLTEVRGEARLPNGPRISCGRQGWRGMCRRRRRPPCRWRDTQDRQLNALVRRPPRSCKPSRCSSTQVTLSYRAGRGSDGRRPQRATRFTRHAASEKPSAQDSGISPTNTLTNFDHHPGPRNPAIVRSTRAGRHCRRQSLLTTRSSRSSGEPRVDPARRLSLTTHQPSNPLPSLGLLRPSNESRISCTRGGARCANAERVTPMCDSCIR